MTVASNQSGSQTATVNTEHTLGSAITSAGTYVLVVETNAMVNGDVLELRAYSKVKSGATEYLAYYVRYAHAQTESNKYSIPVPADTSVKFTLKQTAGTGRAFPWNILSL